MLKTIRHVYQQQSINSFKRFVSSYQHLNLNHTEHGYSIIEMKKGPVNSFNLDFMNELINAIDEVEKNKKSRGLVITSNLKSFGAGLDLVEMCNSSNEWLYSFWTSFQELHLRLYMSSLITMAAINGHAIAGASALTLVCDYRIMVDGKYKIGLPTVHTGILVPRWIAKLFKLIIGPKEAERYLCLGKLSSPHEALSDGLVDEVVSHDELMSRVDIEMKKWLLIPEVGRAQTKQSLHKKYLDEFHGDSNNDLMEFITMISDPVFLEHLKSYTNNLKKR